MSEIRLPTALPSTLLEHAEMRAAITAHDFGTVFRLAREFGKISYSKIAAECDIKPERVGALARGIGQITTFDKIVTIADALRIPGHLLGLATRYWEVPAAPGEAGNGENVRRRVFLKSSATAGAAVGLSGFVQPSVAGNRIGAEVPEYLRRRTARLRRLDDVLGGGDTYPVYLTEYQSTKALLRDRTFSETTGNALRSVLAEQGQQAGWAAFDAGRPDDARGLFLESQQAAQEADDSALAGNALAFLAYQHNSPQSAVDLALESCRTAGTSAPGKVRALLHERMAWACALAGNAADTERALDTAALALSEESDGAAVDWAAWVDEDELDIMRGRCWTELRRPLRAVPVLEKVLDRFKDSHARDKSLYMSWLAQSYLAAGEVEQAAAVTGRALTLCTGVSSVRPRQRLDDVLRLLAPHHGVREVGEVLEQAAS